MGQAAIRLCNEQDFESMLDIINDGAKAYDGHVPTDRLHDPYMSSQELHAEIASGVEFWGVADDAMLVAVMGTQRVQDVTLIRHAYVRSEWQKHGHGGRLLRHLREQTAGRMLVGTWAGAVWAIAFYERYGFRLVKSEEKERLLRKYWNIPERQIETSVVLAD